MNGGSLDAQRRNYTAKLAEAVKRIKEKLVRRPEVELVVLFGSYARGRRDLLTDLDVLVVMRSEKPFVERVAALYRELGVGVDMDLVCYTPEEFARMKESPFVKRALAEGVVLYEKGSTGRGAQVA